ncbi:hypothetical protein CTA2_9231 [Colletotrichum tanaceti]|uniref:Uncharacterized protein n=1 Tax=Colletotrichum tanaceti TaxID=1306861 RepID=A0A4U6XKH2_9PEZI|nr:hypothetical protein CTA2_9231 [Colletotrichum tanaceti]TKW55227.1 hypothetical protein CTA1_9417 [Colletotrichum tanaceti]
MATSLGKMVLDALEGVANKTGRSIGEVLQTAQAIAEMNVVKMEPAEAGEAAPLVKPIGAVATTAVPPAKAGSSKAANIPGVLASSSRAPVASSSKSAAPVASSSMASSSKASSSKASSSKASSSKAAPKTAFAAKGYGPPPKPRSPVSKKAASKAKASASDSDTAASEEPAEEIRADQFLCEFPGCARTFVHRSSRTRVCPSSLGRGAR